MNTMILVIIAITSAFITIRYFILLHSAIANLISATTKVLSFQRFLAMRKVLGLLSLEELWEEQFHSKSNLFQKHFLDTQFFDQKSSKNRPQLHLPSGQKCKRCLASKSCFLISAKTSDIFQFCCPISLLLQNF